MRVNHFLTGTLAAAAMLVASCSTQKMAQNNSADDVYNTTAQARVYKYAPPAQTAQIDTSRYDANYRSSDQTYDMDYASRIDRFYYGSPNRVYFDDYYNVYGYNSWYNPYDWSLGFNYGWGFNRWHNPYSAWAFYGSPYYMNTWGPYSYWGGGFGWRGGFGGGYWGGGYWGGGGWGNNVIVRNDNYRARPNRGAENGIGTRPNGSVIGRGTRTGGTVGATNRTGSRPESYNPSTTTDGSGRSGTVVRDSRPSRSGSSNTESRPTRTTESSRPSYNPPPSSSSSGSSGRTGGGSSGGGSSSSGGRPTRGGGR